MKSYSITKFKKTLINLGLKSNDNVLLVPELFRLGKLEDVNNVEECNWDNGDCCTAKLTDPEEWDDYCTQCLCLDPNEQTTIAPTSTAATSVSFSCNSSC